MKRIITIFIICFAIVFLIGCEGFGSVAKASDGTPEAADGAAGAPAEYIGEQDTPLASYTVGNTAGLVSVLAYGATGDGTTDDTEAIQAAVNSGNTIYFPSGNYRISKPILITDVRFWNIYGQDACFIYTGDDYAFRINAAENCSIAIGEIIAKNGGGIAFYADNVRRWNQYVNLTFSYIECATDCIYIEVSAGWCNENTVYGGRFAGGENGVRVNYLGRDIINGWKFYNCGIEGVKNGFLFDAGKGYIAGMSVINPRYAESYTTILKTAGIVRDCLWIGTYPVKPSEVSCSAQTNRFEILAPIGDTGHRGCIVGGRLMVEKIEYEEAAW